MTESTATLAERWIRGPAEGAGAPVLCLPYAGGGASAYRSWRQVADERVRFLPLRLPGREDRISEPPYRDATELAARIADVAEEIAGERFALFGHSMGALLAFEVARSLRRRGSRAPDHLFVAGSQAPDRLPRRRLHALSSEQLVEELIRLGGTPAAVLQEPQILRLLEPTLRADFELCEIYEFTEEPPLDIPITAIGGTQDERVALAELAAWRRHTSSVFDVVTIEAGHFFLDSARDQLVAAVADRLA